MIDSGAGGGAAMALAFVDEGETEQLTLADGPEEDVDLTDILADAPAQDIPREPSPEDEMLEEALL